MWGVGDLTKALEDAAERMTVRATVTSCRLRYEPA